MSDTQQRRVIYYLPHIKIENTIDLCHCKLKPFSTEESYSDLLPKDLFNPTGSLIEVNGFTSGDMINSKVAKKTFEALEKIKFGYFFLNPSIQQTCYVSNETFECFQIVENANSMAQGINIEKKIEFSNGMFSYLFPLKEYFQSRLLNSNKVIQLTSKDLRYVDYLSCDIDDDNLLTAIRFYNKCWSSYSIFDNMDKPMLAKISIEKLCEYKKIKMKEYTGLFFEDIFNRIKKSRLNCTNNPLFNSMLSNKREIKDKLEIHTNAIKDARDAFAHKGTDTQNNLATTFYLIWFPLFWMVTLRSDKIKVAERIRFFLFYYLLHFDSEDWQKSTPIQTSSDLPVIPGPCMTKLHTYSHFSRVLPEWINGNSVSIEYAKKIIEAFFIDLAEIQEKNITNN